jgi:hypothetical protein
MIRAVRPNYSRNAVLDRLSFTCDERARGRERSKACSAVETYRNGAGYRPRRSDAAGVAICQRPKLAKARSALQRNLSVVDLAGVLSGHAHGGRRALCSVSTFRGRDAGRGADGRLSVDGCGHVDCIEFCDRTNLQPARTGADVGQGAWYCCLRSSYDAHGGSSVSGPSGGHVQPRLGGRGHACDPSEQYSISDFQRLTAAYNQTGPSGPDEMSARGPECRPVASAMQGHKNA